MTFTSNVVGTQDPNIKRQELYLMSFVTDDKAVKGRPNESIVDEFLNKPIVELFEIEDGFRGFHR